MFRTYLERSCGRLVSVDWRRHQWRICACTNALSSSRSLASTRNMTVILRELLVSLPPYMNIIYFSLFLWQCIQLPLFEDLRTKSFKRIPSWIFPFLTMLNIDFQSDSETDFGGKILAQALLMSWVVESIFLLQITHLPQSSINGCSAILVRSRFSVLRCKTRIPI